MMPASMVVRVRELTGAAFDGLKIGVGGPASASALPVFKN